MAIAILAYQLVRIGRRSLGLKMTGQFRRGGFQWQLDLAQGIDFCIFITGMFEPSFVRSYRKLIKTGDVVVDIGANIGAHSLPFARTVGPKGKVYAIEATKFAYDKLMKNLDLNAELKSVVTPFHMLLDESHDSAVEEAIYASWPLNSNNDRHEIHRGQLESVGNAAHKSLDEFVADEKIKHIDWLKIDVDGNELKILNGAGRVLKNIHPAILLELAPDCHHERDQNQLSEIINLLKKANYNFFRLPGRKPLSVDAFRLEKLIPSGASINILLLPT